METWVEFGLSRTMFENIDMQQVYGVYLCQQIKIGSTGIVEALTYYKGSYPINTYLQDLLK